MKTLISIGNEWVTAPNIINKNKTWTGLLANRLGYDYQLDTLSITDNIRSNTFIFNATIDAVESWIGNGNSTDDLLVIVVWDWIIFDNLTPPEPAIPLTTTEFSDNKYIDGFYKRLFTLNEYLSNREIKYIITSAAGYTAENTNSSLSEESILEFNRIYESDMFKETISWRNIWISFAEIMARAGLYKSGLPTKFEEGFDVGWLPNEKSHLAIADYIEAHMKEYIIDNLNWDI